MGGGTSSEGGDGNLSDQVVASALRYRAQAPLVDQLLSEVGLTGGGLNGLTAALRTSDVASDRPSSSNHKAARASAKTPGPEAKSD